MNKFNSMMSEKEKRETIDQIAKDYDTTVILLENPSFATGLIGWVEDGDKIRAVYSDVKCVEDLMNDNNWDYETAQEFFDYNTVRALPYCHSEEASCPLMIHEFE